MCFAIATITRFAKSPSMVSGPIVPQAQLKSCRTELRARWGAWIGLIVGLLLVLLSWPVAAQTPFPVVTGLSNPSALALDGNYIYFGENPGSTGHLSRAPKTGGPREQLLTGKALHDSGSIVGILGIDFSPTHIYFGYGGYQNTLIEELPRGGSTTRVLGGSSGGGRFSGVLGSDIYYFRDCCLLRLGMAIGATPVQVTSAVFPRSTARDQNSLYFFDLNSLNVYRYDAGTVNSLVPLITGNASEGAVFLDSTNVYLAVGELVRKVSKLGGTVTNIALPASGEMRQADDAFIYFTVGAQLWRQSFAGSGSAEIVSSGIFVSGDMVSDAEFLYWADTSAGNGAGVIKGLQKAPSVPRIANLSPNSGPVGAPIIIRGAGFGATQGSSTVQICGLTPTLIHWEQGIIAIGVPQLATGTVCNVRITTGFGSSVATFTVTARTTLSGVVLDGTGKPLLGAKISLSGGPTPGAVLTDLKGHYTLAGLASGMYTVVPELLGYQFSQPSQTISVNGSPVVASNLVGLLGKPVLTGTNPVRAQFATPPDQPTQITIKGYSFGSQNADSKVMVGNVVARLKPNEWSSTQIVVYLPPQPDPNVPVYEVAVFTTAGKSNVKGFSYKLKPLQVLVTDLTGLTTGSGLLAAPQDVLLPVYTQPSPGATTDSVTQVITIQNNAQTWYWVKPASSLVSGSGLPTNAFLLGPGQQRSFGPLTFLRKGAYLQLFADNSLCGKTYAELFACARNEPQSEAILRAITMEIAWRMAFGSPAPTTFLAAIEDPIVAGLSLYYGEGVSLAHDTVKAMLGDPYALAQLPTDVLGFMRTTFMIDLMAKYGVTGGIDPALLNWSKIAINTGITSKFLVETLIYPNTGTLTFKAQ